MEDSYQSMPKDEIQGSSERFEGKAGSKNASASFELAGGLSGIGVGTFNKNGDVMAVNYFNSSK